MISSALLPVEETLTRVAVATREGNELGSGGRKAASTGDLDLRALRVELLYNVFVSAWAPPSTKRTHSGHGVEGDGLKTDEVVARGHACGDRARPARVLIDHLARSPLATVNGAGKETRLVDLEPLRLRGVDTSA